MQKHEEKRARLTVGSRDYNGSLKCKSRSLCSVSIITEAARARVSSHNVQCTRTDVIVVLFWRYFAVLRRPRPGRRRQRRVSDAKGQSWNARCDSSREKENTLERRQQVSRNLLAKTIKKKKTTSCRYLTCISARIRRKQRLPKHQYRDTDKYFLHIWEILQNVNYTKKKKKTWRNQIFSFWIYN